MRKIALPGSLLLGSLVLSGQSIRINEIQIIGSHNSYHAGIAPNEMAYLRKTMPAVAEALDYSHPTLTAQLDAGVRQLELDVFGDRGGGLFAKPAMPAIIEKAGYPADEPFDPAGLMRKPGFKVLHVQDLDYRSNCQPFTACLAEVRAWSKAHASHLPIFILIENKDGNPRPDYMVKPEAFTNQTFDDLDAEIRSVFAPGDLIVPDNVRGKHKTLEEAVLTSGWPRLDDSRGRIIFLFDQERIGPLYTTGHPSLEGRAVFTNAKPGTPDAAFLKMNDAQSIAIPDLVKRGYLVRTMSDPGPKLMRQGDTRRRDAALSSGAQLISTDYPFDKKFPASGYSVRFEEGIVRCNPVIKSAACRLDLLKEKTPSKN